MPGDNKDENLHVVSASPGLLADPAQGEGGSGEQVPPPPPGSRATTFVAVRFSRVPSRSRTQPEPSRTTMTMRLGAYSVGPALAPSIRWMVRFVFAFRPEYRAKTRTWHACP